MTRFLFNLRRSVWVFALIPVVASVVLWLPASAQVLVQDGDFELGDWSQVKLMDTTPGGAIDVRAAQLPSGGNPGAHRQVTLTFGPGSGDLLSAHVFTVATYNPSVQGAIASVSWSAAIRGDPGIENAQFGYSLLVKQGGDYFQWWAHTVSGGGWVAAGDAGLAAGDLYPAGDAAGIGRPDFTAAGGALEFGFLLGKQDLGPIVLQTGIDNWQVTVTPVPEPAAWSLLTGAGLVLGALGRSFLRRPALAIWHCRKSLVSPDEAARRSSAPKALLL